MGCGEATVYVRGPGTPTQTPTSQTPTTAPFPIGTPEINNFNLDDEPLLVPLNEITRIKVLDTCTPAPGQGPLMITNITSPAQQGVCAINIRQNRIQYTPEGLFNW